MFYSIKEGLRLYPSVPLIARHLNEDVYIPGDDNKRNALEVFIEIFY